MRLVRNIPCENTIASGPEPSSSTWSLTPLTTISRTAEAPDEADVATGWDLIAYSRSRAASVAALLAEKPIDRGVDTAEGVVDAIDGVVDGAYGVVDGAYGVVDGAVHGVADPTRTPTRAGQAGRRRARRASTRATRAAGSGGCPGASGAPASADGGGAAARGRINRGIAGQRHRRSAQPAGPAGVGLGGGGNGVGAAGDRGEAAGNAGEARLEPDQGGNRYGHNAQCRAGQPTRRDPAVPPSK